MRLAEAATAVVMREPGWTMQLRNGDVVVADVKVTPSQDARGWRVDALFGPWGEQKSWTDVVLSGPFGIEEPEPSAASVARGSVYAHTIRVGGTDV